MLIHQNSAKLLGWSHLRREVNGKRENGDGTGRKRKKYTRLLHILQSKNAKRRGPTKTGREAGLKGQEGGGETWSLSFPLLPPPSFLGS